MPYTHVATVNQFGSLPSSLKITKGPSHPCCKSPCVPPLLQTINHPMYLLSATHCPSHRVTPSLTVNDPGYLTPSSRKKSITQCTFPSLPMVDHTGSLPLHCRSPQVPPLHSTLSITQGLSSTFPTVNHPGSLPTSLSITQVPPLPTGNHPGTLFSPLLCQSPQAPLLFTLNHPGSLHFLWSITPGPAFHHCQSPSSLPPHSQWSLPSTLSINKVPLLPVINHAGSPPLLTVSHPKSLPSPLSITSGPSPLLLTVNHPRFLFFPPHCKSPRVHSLFTVNHKRSLASLLSITQDSSSPHCQSPWVPPLPFVNHPGSFLAPPHYQSTHVLPLPTVNHSRSLHPKFLLSPPYCQ